MWLSIFGYFQIQNEECTAKMMSNELTSNLCRILECSNKIKNYVDTVILHTNDICNFVRTSHSHCYHNNENLAIVMTCQNQWFSSVW